MIVCDDVYGGTHQYLKEYSKENYGVDVEFIDLTNI